MRQVHIQVPRGDGAELAAAAEDLGASTLTRVEGHGGHDEEVDLLVMTVPNSGVEDLLDRAHEFGAIEASIPAGGAFAFEPPRGEPPEELVDVSTRSGYEVVLAGQQAAGDWIGFITYSTVAGVVVWLGLFTETIYLLTAAMLIAPFAGPAMNTAISVVSGRTGLLRHSLARYAVGIGLAASVCAALTLITGQEVVPGLLADVLTITPVAVLLPLAAGAAGATYLLQSEHSSLISGAAVGILVAASLAPPAGGLGMTLALGRPELALHAAFVVALQLTGITTTAVIVLHLYGIGPTTSRYSGERTQLVRWGLGLAVLLTVGLVGLQLATEPALVQGSRAREATTIATRVLTEDPQVQLVRVDPTVASTGLEGPPRVIVDILVERRPDAPPPEVVTQQLRAELSEQLNRQLQDVVTHVDLSVFDSPEGTGG